MTKNPESLDNTPKCGLCGSKNVNDFFKLPPVPTQDGVMCATEQEATQVVKGSVELRLCNDCGYVGNEGHEVEKISFNDYDFSNDQSQIFAQFTKDLSDRLIENYSLKNKTILDVGCGDGDFLRTICERGANKGIGIDPGFDISNRKSDSGTDVTFIRDYYSEKYSHLKADLVASRLVISLPNDPVALIKIIRQNLEDQPETIVYFDIPDIRYTLSQKVIWNVVYEHRSWFSKESLTYLMELCGFEVVKVSSCWHDEYISIEARIQKDKKPLQLPAAADVAELAAMASDFADEFSGLVKATSARIDIIRKEGKKVLAWSAGARAVTFFNLFDIKKEVPFIVDINTNRQGKYLPGSAQQIVSPEFALEYQPDILLITNPTYAQEIKDHVKSMGLTPEFWVL